MRADPIDTDDAASIAGMKSCSKNGVHNHMNGGRVPVKRLSRRICAPELLRRHG
jgi:hypothetical protein